MPPLFSFGTHVVHNASKVHGKVIAFQMNANGVYLYYIAKSTAPEFKRNFFKETELHEYLEDLKTRKP